MKITAHVLVKNEARFVWYSVMSAIKYVDEIKIWDTGSTDGTIQIIEEIAKTDEARKKEHFDFRKLEEKVFDEALVRQKMLQLTNTDWFIMLDADEIWWDDSIRQVIKIVKTSGEKYESIIVPTINLVGDVFHYQEKEAARYNFLGKRGHYALRALNRKIPGLVSLGEHGTWGWSDEDGKMIQDRDSSKILFLNAPYLHVTHLKRSGAKGLDKKVFKRSKKFKYELGVPFPLDYYYPEVFFRKRNKIVPSVWEPAGFNYKFRAFFETPLKKIYRRTILPFERHGY